MLRVSLLGDFCIRQNEKPITDIATPRLQSLLAYLILHRNAPQSRAHLAFLFWPDTTESQARTNLRNLLHHLRRTLPDADAYIDIRTQTLHWRSDMPMTLDVAEFESSLVKEEQSFHQNNLPAVRTALEQSISIYKGDLLPSSYDDWLIPKRESLRQAYLNCLERLVHLLEEQRDYPAAISNAQRLLLDDPLHEGTYRRLIRLHALNGDRASALRIYHTCASILRRELDVEPSTATREAYQQLLGTDTSPHPTVQATPAFSPLIGRDSLWAQMLHAWSAVASGGEPQVLLLSGEAGIGKTRLLEELFQWTARQGIRSASARCYAAEGDLAYSPITAWLRAYPLMHLDEIWLAEVARLLPEILTQRPDLQKPAALTESWQRKLLFEALARAILGANQPLLLTIDDLQWCDRDTLEWLHFLLRFDHDARLLVVGAYRPEEIVGDHPLVSFLQALRMDRQVIVVELQPLDEAGTQSLAISVGGGEMSKEIAQILYAETEGNPLFVVETVRAGLPVHDRGLNTEIHGDPITRDAGLPPKVRSVLEARLAQVSPPTRTLARLAATIGRDFSFRLLAKSSGSDEDTLVRELDELWQRRIVREHGSDAYDFSHDKLREVAYLGMSAAQRRLMHHHVAQALEILNTPDLNPVCRQLATHYELAGLPEKALPHYLCAARMARQVYANEEAITLLQRGLALLKDDATRQDRDKGMCELAAQLWEELGDVLEIKALHEDALQAFQNAQVWIHSDHRIWQARLHRKTGEVLREQRLYVQALDACHQAELALGEQPDDDSSIWWAEWLEVQAGQVWAHYWLAQWIEMEALVKKIQPVVQEHGSPANRMRFLWTSSMMQLRRDRYVVSDEMLSDGREGLAVSQSCGSLRTRIEWQFEVGFFHLWRHELDEAEEYLHAALILTETAGLVPMRILALTYLTVLNRFRCQLDEVQNLVLIAQEAAAAAHMPDYVAAAKGNQAWLAWRTQDLSTAEQIGREAIALWRQSPLVYPFQWQALWPLVGVASAQDRKDDLWAYIHAMLESTQQILPVDLSTSLEDAVKAKVKGQPGEDRLHLNQAFELALKMGYL